MSLRLSLVSTERALSRPARNARQGWAARSACLVTLRGDDGNYGSGEASPLPGFSQDTLADCEAALAALDTSTLPARLLPSQSAPEELTKASQRLPAQLPAARAALEGALLDLWSRAAEKPAWVLISTPNQSAPSPRPVAALLQGEPEEAREQAQAAHARGIRCFKFKIGRANMLERELAAVRQMREALGPAVQLRLDANQSFNAELANAALPRFLVHDIELVEEPCPPGELARLSAVNLPLALDESLSTLSPVALNPRVRALVLKPTLLGGISACFAWAEVARQSAAQVILSHTFDGPAGLMLSAALALVLGSEASSHGLDLEGARLETLRLPAFSGAYVVPWAEPGFGMTEHGT